MEAGLQNFYLQTYKQIQEATGEKNHHVLMELRNSPVPISLEEARRRANAKRSAQAKAKANRLKEALAKIEELKQKIRYSHVCVDEEEVEIEHLPDIEAFIHQYYPEANIQVHLGHQGEYVLSVRIPRPAVPAADFAALDAAAAAGRQRLLQQRHQQQQAPQQQQQQQYQAPQQRHIIRPPEALQQLEDPGDISSVGREFFYLL